VGLEVVFDDDIAPADIDGDRLETVKMVEVKSAAAT